MSTKRSDLIYVDQLQEAISGAFAGAEALFGTGAAILNTSLPSFGPDGNKLKGGDLIRVPYFDTIGELEDVGEDQALTPVKLSMSSETAPVIHSGKAGEITNWAQLTAQFSDPYAEYGKQFKKAWIRRIDKGLIDKAATTTLVYDNSANGAGLITWDAMNDAVTLWGDEGDIDSIVLMVAHSKVVNDLWKMKDSTGMPLMVNPQEGRLPRFRGVPVKASDRVPVTAGVYDSLIIKRGALVAWANGTPTPLADQDILADTDVIAIHTYHVEHLYKRPAGGTKTGVVKLKTKAST